MIDIAMKLLGAAMAAAYLGYMAYSIGSLPLWIISAISLVLMAYGFYKEHQEELSFGDIQRRQRQQ